MKKRKKLVNKLQNRYRLIIYNDTTFQSVFNIKLTRLRVFTITSIFTAIMVSLILLLVSNTELREFIPGYPTAEYRKQLVENTLLVDSLENELKKRDLFFDNIKAVVSGNLPITPILDTFPLDTQIKFKEYNHDSIFEDKLIAEKISLSSQSTKDQLGINKIHFFLPIKGVVTNEFDYDGSHYGIDIVSKSNTRISAVLDGRVIFAGWTLETGHILYIQHRNNLISAYKHNSELLKKIGDRVNAGEAIAIIGNSGEQSTGPHLHFELWHDMKPLNPRDYIDF